MVSPRVEKPEPLTAADNSLRFADGIVDEGRKRIITVQEDHSGSGEAVNTIAAIGNPKIHRMIALQLLRLLPFPSQRIYDMRQISS